MADFPDWSLAQSVVLLTESVAAGNPSSAIDISRFTTVLVKLQCDGINLPAVTYIQVGPSGQNLDVGVLSADSASGSPYFALECLGQSMTFTNNTLGAITVTVVGTNAVTPKRLLANMYGVDSRAVTVANGSPTLTVSKLLSTLSAANTLDGNVSSTAGQVALRWTLSAMGGATSWVLFAGIIKEDGTRVLIPVTSTTATLVFEFMWGHPWQYTSWYVRNTGALAAAVSATLTVTPAS